jgi:hypothetical protein
MLLLLVVPLFFLTRSSPRDDDDDDAAADALVDESISGGIIVTRGIAERNLLHDDASSPFMICVYLVQESS